MTEEVWLDPVFTRYWQGQDAFNAARNQTGDISRELEQRQTLAFNVEGKRYFIKKHRGVALGEILKNILTLRMPVVSAHNEYSAIKALSAVGVNVPVVAAYGRKGVLPSQLESFLVTRDVGPHQSLEDFCRPWKQTAPGFTLKFQLIKEVAEISRRMHAEGICHRDFYLCHFLRLDSTAQLTLIDLHRALLKTSLGQRWVIKDLGGLWFSAMDIGLTKRDLLRFIRHYREGSWREVLASEAKFWVKVQDRAEKLYNKS